MAVVIPLKLVYTPVDATVTAIRNYQVPSTKFIINQTPVAGGDRLRDERTHPHRPRLVVYRSTCPPLSSSPPRDQLCNRSCSNKHTHCHGPQRTALSGLWAIPSTESGPQPLLDTYNLSSLALTPGEPTPYVCMSRYVSMVHTHMWYVRGYVLGEEGVNVSSSIGRNSKLEG